MELTINGTNREIADFVLLIQNRLSENKISGEKACNDMFDRFIESFVATRDNGEEYCGQ